MLADRGEVTVRNLARPNRMRVQAASMNNHVLQVYRKLGGILKDFPINLRKPWDIEFRGCAIELDEELHFNRYRALTLEAEIYSDLGHFPCKAYKSYCLDREEGCLVAGGYGKKWTSPSTERQFGVSSPPKQLAEPGPARWKQRAFYDFLKDLSPLIIGIPVVRISIWDRIEIDGNERSVNWALKHPNKSAASAIVALFEDRLPNVNSRL